MADSRQERRVPPDPAGVDEPHDVLAAEEFGIGTRDERIPPDPHRGGEPHDVLAAEEFGMPGGPDRTFDPEPPPDRVRTLLLALLAALAALALLRRRRS